MITADAYGAGEADRLLGEALQGVERDSYCLMGAIGHDFYTGEREGAKGFPRFTDPRLRGEERLRGVHPHGDRAQPGAHRRRALRPAAAAQPRSHRLHERRRVGGDAGGPRGRAHAAAGGGAGPANGFTLDLIDCIERFGELIDWAMIILSPLEPWPGELVLDAAAAHEVSLITRVVDYGGMFHDDVLPGHEFAEYDHRKFRPEGWVEEGREKLERMRPYAERHGLSMLQLACQWNLAHPAVRCVAPTLIQEAAASDGGGGGRGSQLAPRPIEDKRAELAALAPCDRRRRRTSATTRWRRCARRATTPAAWR